MYWYPNYLAVVFKKQEISQQVVTGMQDLQRMETEEKSEWKKGKGREERN